MIPAITPDYGWVEYHAPEPSLRIQYPIITKDQQYGLFHEVVTDWHDKYAVLAGIGWLRFDGDVWTIQLTARPGYYVTPEQMERYGNDPGTFPPMG